MTTEPLCPFGEILDRRALGDASDEDRARLEDHLAAGCPFCAPVFAAQARLEKMVQGALAPLEREVEQRRGPVLDRLRDAIAREDDARAQRRMLRRSIRFAFTAIVLSTVVLLSVAYLGYVALLGKRRAHLIATTRVEVRALVLALDAYSRERGDLPPAADPASLVRALSTPRRDGARAYFDFDPARVRDGRFLDPFGRPYVYKHDFPKKARVLSVGPNGRDEDGLGDDIAQDLVISR